MMKHLSLRVGLVAACAALTIFGRSTSVVAAEPDQAVPADRLERLERRVNELAQHQEQLMRRLGTQEGQAPVAAQGRENMRPPIRMPGRAAPEQPMPPLGAPELAPAPGAPLAHDAKAHEGIAGLIRLCCLVAFLFNILAAIWIFTDIRRRGEGSGIFIALALLAGVPAAIIYALVRIGDKKV
jgi:hypothetical protein